MPTHYKGTEQEKEALELFIKLHRATDSVSARSYASIAETGLTMSQFGILETLYHLGPLKPSQLAEKHLKSRNNFTLVIDNLEKLGYVRRERGQKDRRSILVSLTEEGRSKITELFPLFAATLEKQVQVLTKSELAELSRLLKILGTGQRKKSNDV